MEKKRKPSTQEGWKANLVSGDRPIAAELDGDPATCPHPYSGIHPWRQQTPLVPMLPQPQAQTPPRGIIFITAASRRPSLQPPSYWFAASVFFTGRTHKPMDHLLLHVGVHTGLDSTQTRDQDDGSIWVGYGLIHSFAEPVNRAMNTCRMTT